MEGSHSPSLEDITVEFSGYAVGFVTAAIEPVGIRVHCDTSYGPGSPFTLSPDEVELRVVDQRFDPLTATLIRQCLRARVEELARRIDELQGRFRGDEAVPASAHLGEVRELLTAMSGPLLRGSK